MVDEREHMRYICCVWRGLVRGKMCGRRRCVDRYERCARCRQMGRRVGNCIIMERAAE